MTLEKQARLSCLLECDSSLYYTSSVLAKNVVTEQLKPLGDLFVTNKKLPSKTEPSRILKFTAGLYWLMMACW